MFHNIATFGDSKMNSFFELLFPGGAGNKSYSKTKTQKHKKGLLL